MITIKEEDICFINNLDVRWYLSSQSLWVSTLKDLFEIEKSPNQYCGSFQWLWSGTDTILFDNDTLSFKNAILKIQEPLNVKDGNLKFNDVIAINGNIKLNQSKNFNCSLSSQSTFFYKENNLLSYDKIIALDERINLIKVTQDFSFLLQQNKLVGWVLQNASLHLLPEDIKKCTMEISLNQHMNNVLIELLKQFFVIVKKLEYESDKNIIYKSKQELERIHQQISVIEFPQFLALKDTIKNVLDYL